MTCYQAGASIYFVDESYEEIKEYTILSSSKGGVILIDPELTNAIDEQIRREFGAIRKRLTTRAQMKWEVKGTQKQVDTVGVGCKEA